MCERRTGDGALERLSVVPRPQAGTQMPHRRGVVVGDHANPVQKPTTK